jgi:hypothetical protein
LSLCATRSPFISQISHDVGRSLLLRWSGSEMTACAALLNRPTCRNSSPERWA